MGKTIILDLAGLAGWLQAHGFRLHRSYLNDGGNAVLVAEALPVVAPASLVGFTGSRKWRDRERIKRVVATVLRPGRHVAVGCALGADQAVIRAVLEAGQARRLTIYAAFGPKGQGSWTKSAASTVRRAFDAGAHVRWWAGASRWISPYAKARLPLTRRLVSRSLALVQAVAASAPNGQGAGLIAFAGAPPPRPFGSGPWPSCGSGIWATVAAAARRGIPVVMFASGFSEGRLPGLSEGGGRQ